MSQIGEIEIKISGRKGEVALSPDNFDISELKQVFDLAEQMLFPGKGQRPTITYRVEEGSVRNFFRTSMQAVVGFHAIFGQIQATNSIDFLEPSTARAIESFQDLARKHDYTIDFRTSQSETILLSLSKESRLQRSTELWVDTEYYFYGELENAGGSKSPNLHLRTKEHGLLIVAARKELLANLEENILYRRFGLRAKGKQNLATVEIDTKSFELLELIDYNPKFDQNYLDNLIGKASAHWSDVNDVDEWLRNLRADD